jgi:hypothetical protein
VHASRISKENQETYTSTGHKPDGDWFTIGRSAADIHITVAGGLLKALGKGLQKFWSIVVHWNIYPLPDWVYLCPISMNLKIKT